MTPTDLGEAPYVFHPASAGSVTPLVMGVRFNDDRAAVARRVRAAAAAAAPRIHIEDLRPLDELARIEEIEPIVGAALVVGIVLLGLFLSATGIYSLVSVSVARRTREIGLRSALGASPSRMLTSIFSTAARIVGSGIAVGNLILLLFITIAFGRIPVAPTIRALTITSAVMLTVALLACVTPARRALRIHPTDALRHL